MKNKKLGKRGKMAIIISVSLILIIAIVATVCLVYFLDVPECVGSEKYKYEIKEIHVEHDGIDLYGKALIPQGDGKYPTVIYAHGANSNYKADYTTLKSLAMSGIACYTFDFYGWTKRSDGPNGKNFFSKTPKSNNDAYIEQLFNQVKDLDAVIEKVKTFDFVDTNNIYLVGSSMGGATVATCAVNHSSDIRAIVLQYPAIHLNEDAMVTGAEYDVNKYTGDVLILHGTADKVIPLEMSEQLCAHYNTLREDHAVLRIYYKQPHVFNNGYKVVAAREIFDFISDHK